MIWNFGNVGLDLWMGMIGSFWQLKLESREVIEEIMAYLGGHITVSPENDARMTFSQFSAKF